MFQGIINLGLQSEYRNILKAFYGTLKSLSYDSSVMYNPFSLLNTFANMRLGNYWFETGTPTL